MNPYRWSGPDFLLVYSQFGLAVVALVWWKNRGAGSATASGDVNLTDPYEIAYLRGGAIETITVAIVKLLQARVLQPGPLNLVETTDAGAPVQAALEASIAEFARHPAEPDAITAHAPIQALADTYRAGLEAKGLLNSVGAKDAAKWRIGIAAAILGAMAVARVAQGLVNGKPALFLAMVTVLVVAGLHWAGMPRHRTAAGDAALWTVQGVFENQREPSADAAANEIALAAAVFGVAAVPLVALPGRDRLFRRKEEQRSSSCHTRRLK